MTRSDRERELHGILRSMMTLSRILGARGRHPFQERGLGRRQMDVLFFVAQAGRMTVGELARALGVTSGAISQVLDSLRDARLVSVTPDPGDRRTRVVIITPDAAAEIDRFQEEYVRSLEPDFVRLSTAELSELNRLLALSLAGAREPLEAEDTGG